MNTGIRRPIVAGQFYPSDPPALKKQIDSFVDPNTQKINALGCMLPHAGYMYSGRVAAETLSSLYVKDNVLLLGPNHTGSGSQLAIITSGSWETPLGASRINSRLAKKILSGSDYLQEDYLAHAHEHSLEVELPLLQYFNKKAEIIPIAFMTDDIDTLKKVGKEIARVILEQDMKDNLLTVVSSDMTHYEARETAKEKDSYAIKAILNLDEEALVKNIRKYRISMCGFTPAVVMISMLKDLGAKGAKLIKYATSGDVTGDNDSVVGYAGIVVY